MIGVAGREILFENKSISFKILLTFLSQVNIIQVTELTTPIFDADQGESFLFKGIKYV